MNRHTFGAVLAATLGATLALASPTLLAAKPNADPCLQPGIDFPAFTYVRRIRSSGAQIIVADATGKCSRLLYERTNSIASEVKFSYPVAGTPDPDTGRVVWMEGAVVYGLTFKVTGTSISPSLTKVIYDDDEQILTIELSKDGNTVYAAWVGSTGAEAGRIIAINMVDNGQSNAFVGAPGEFYSPITFNEDGALFVPYHGQLLRIPPSCGDLLCAEPVQTPTSALFPAAQLAGTRLVYSYGLPGLIQCWLLQVIEDTGGPILDSAQPRYGTSSTWLGDKILTNGHKPPPGSGVCTASGMITQIDPDTSAETELVKGLWPDAR